MSKNQKSMKKAQKRGDIASYILLIILSFIWIFPFIVILLTSFRGEPNDDKTYIIPKEWSFNNYITLFTDTNVLNFPLWLKNTFIVAVAVTFISTFFVLSVSYTMSRMRFKMRRTFLNVALVLGMFPGFMSMIAIYLMLDIFNLTGKLTALVLCYSAASGLGFYIAKGFFDTIPKAMDEAAWIDGATRWKVFTKITIPLSRPIIIYTVLTSFLGPWTDFIFVNTIMRTTREKYTVALGLRTMILRDYMSEWYTRFCAGSVIVSIPLVILFLSTQKYYSEGLSGSVKG